MRPDGLIDRQDVAGALKGPRREQHQRYGWTPGEERDSVAADDREDGQVQLINEALEQQFVPQLPA
jgi:hypothetical protein